MAQKVVQVQGINWVKHLVVAFLTGGISLFVWTLPKAFKRATTV